MKNFCYVLLLFLLAACTSKYGITRAQAYVQESIAGTVRVDQNGRPTSSPVTKRHLIYIEAADSLPNWGTAWVEQKPYSVRVVEVKDGQLIGKTPEGADVVVSAKEGNKLWQLVLTPKQAETEKDQSLKEKIDNIMVLLTGTWKNKGFAYKIDDVKHLQQAEMQ